MARSSSRPGKKIFHKIGEVCELTKTEPYVLRYWESEFPFLAPEKNRAGQRIYTDEDIQTVLAIKRLLYEEGYTTAGARRKLEQERRDGGSDSAAGAAATGAAVEAATPGSPAVTKTSADGPPEAVAESAPASGPDASEADQGLRDGLRRLRDELRALKELLSE